MTDEDALYQNIVSNLSSSEWQISQELRKAKEKELAEVSTHSLCL